MKKAFFTMLMLCCILTAGAEIFTHSLTFNPPTM